MNNQDPFSEFRINRSVEQPTQKNNSKQQDQDPFSEFRLKKSEDFPFIYETGRHASRIASRIAETIGGIPGDIDSLIQSGVMAGLQKLTGKELSPETKQAMRKGKPPTSKELKEFSEEKTGGFTKAQNETERYADEIAETAASLLGPMKFRRALGIGLASTSAKEGVKLLGLGETSQEATKLGTMLMLTALNPGGAMKYASSQFDKANALSRGASIQATNMRGHLENLLKDLQKGVTTPSKNAVIRPIEDILDKAKKNKILVHDLTAAKRDLNSLMKDPELLKREKKLLKGVAKEIDDAIKPYERINPAFSKAYRPANEIYGAVMQGTKAFDFIKKNLGGKSLLGAALGEVALGHPEYIIPTMASAGAAAGVAKTGDFFTRIAKSPELQKYYIKALSAAAKEDLPSLRIYADKIEEEINSNPHKVLYPSNSQQLKQK
jgi:hypothetical protein